MVVGAGLVVDDVYDVGLVDVSDYSAYVKVV